MKKITLLLILLLPAVFASGKRNNTFTEGKLQYRVVGYSDGLEVADSAVYIIGFDRSVVTGSFLDKELVIPATVIHDGYTYKVEGVWDYAFAQCDDIERVVISDGVENIESGAFSDCHNLQSVFISQTISRIGYTFTSCPNLREIVVDERNPEYDSRENCNAIIRKRDDALVLGCYTTVIPESVLSIDSGAFCGCWKLEHISLPEGVFMLGSAFIECVNLQSIQLPRSLEYIKGCVFRDCSRLKSVYIPENVSEIEECNLFAGCVSLDTVIVDSRNTVYDSRQGCNAIIRTDHNKLLAGCRRTVIPEGVKEIGEQVFYNTPIPRIHIPASVTYINPRAFNRVNGCAVMTVDEKNPVYDSRNNCNAIIETAVNKIVAGCCTSVIPKGVTEIGENAFSSSILPSVFIIPEGIRKIGDWAFAYTKFDTVVIPASVENIELGAFSNSMLSQIYWKGHIDRISPCVFENCNNLQVAHIPEGVRTIAFSAFEQCRNLVAVSLPESLEEIYYTAFKDTPCEESIKKHKAEIIYKPQNKCPVCSSYQND